MEGSLIYLIDFPQMKIKLHLTLITRSRPLPLTIEIFPIVISRNHSLVIWVHVVPDFELPALPVSIHPLRSHSDFFSYLIIILFVMPAYFLPSLNFPHCFQSHYYFFKMIGYYHPTLIHLPMILYPRFLRCWRIRLAVIFMNQMIPQLACLPGNLLLIANRPRFMIQSSWQSITIAVLFEFSSPWWCEPLFDRIICHLLYICGPRYQQK